MTNLSQVNINIFTNLPGTWNFRRNLIADKPNQLLGVVNGQAKLSFRVNSNNELYYVEQGELIINSHNRYSNHFKINKEYIYCYCEQTEQIKKYFTQDGKKGNIFYILSFAKCNNNNAILYATGEHLCIQDNYQANYKFYPKEFNKFILTYKVKGPQKDYKSETIYEKI